MIGIPLKQAYKLCNCIKDGGVYLHPFGTNSIDKVWLSDKKIRNSLDMKSVKVVKISPHISICDGAFMGMCFEVLGVTAQDLNRLTWT